MLGKTFKVLAGNFLEFTKRAHLRKFEAQGFSGRESFGISHQSGTHRSHRLEFISITPPFNA